MCAQEERAERGNQGNNDGNAGDDRHLYPWLQRPPNSRASRNGNPPQLLSIPTNKDRIRYTNNILIK